MADRRLFPAALALGLAVVPGAAQADLRIEEKLTSLESSVTRWTMIKADKRSIVTRADTKGVLYNAGAKHGAYVEIARPDKELIWEIDPQERSYRELTSAQFTKLLQKGIQAPRTANDQPLRTLYKSETTAIEVSPTGKTKRIAGYSAEEVMARVVIGATNLLSGNKLSFTFDQTVWITKDETLMSEMGAFEEAYVDVFGSAANLQQAQLLAGSWNDAFIPHLRAMSDRIRALKGVILASSTTVTEQALAQDKNEKSKERTLQVASSEIKKISVETLPESEFELPAGYINADTKVAVAPKLPTPDVAPVPTPKPEVVASEKPVMPESAVSPTPTALPEPPKVALTPKPVGPAVAANTSVPPSVGPPSNVIVKNGNTTSASGKTPVTRIESYVAPPIQGSSPVLALNGAGSAGPSVITVDEVGDPFFNPATDKKKKKRKK